MNLFNRRVKTSSVVLKYNKMLRVLSTGRTRSTFSTISGCGESKLASISSSLCTTRNSAISAGGFRSMTISGNSRSSSKISMMPSSFQVIHHANQSLNIVFGDPVDKEENHLLRPLILSPISKEIQNKAETIRTSSAITENDFVQSVTSEIEKHYAIENSEQFVGGMGENDGGVWMVSGGTGDTLDYWEVIREIIKEVKENRHGIPFGLYTSGLSSAPESIYSELKTEIGLSSIQVSLLSHAPDKYASLRKMQDISQAQKDFGQVCNFVVNAAESGFPVVAAVAGGEHAKGASELAKALGAVDIVVYDNVGVD